MEKLLDKFLRYVAVETTSEENSESQPSTAKQLNLLGMHGIVDNLSRAGNAILGQIDVCHRIIQPPKKI